MIRKDIDELSLSMEERYGLALMRLSCWEWDEIFGPEPEGWETLPDYPGRWRDRVLRRLGLKKFKWDYIEEKWIWLKTDISPEVQKKCREQFETRPSYDPVRDYPKTQWEKWRAKKASEMQRQLTEPPK